MINETISVINETLINSSLLLNTVGNKIDCGTIIASIQDKVDNTSRLIIFVSAGLLMFKMWAINRIIASKEKQEKKDFLIGFTNTMITSILIIFSFYLIYFIYIVNIDF